MRVLARCIGVLAAALPAAVSAQEVDPCIFSLPCISGGGAGFAGFVQSNVVPYLVALFIALAVGAFFYYAFRLVTESRENENAMKEAKAGYEHLMFACAVVGVATLIVAAFGRSASGTLVNPGPIAEAFINATFFFRFLVGAVLTATIVAEGFLIIISNEEGELTKHRKRLINAGLGVAIILLANSLVQALQPGSGSSILAEEVRGIGNYFLVIFIVLCVVAMLVAGAFYLLSADEGLKDKAKATMKTVIVSLVVVLCSYLIVAYFIIL